MNVVYSDMMLKAEDFLGKSIFLAGPTPRNDSTPSWRPNALQILEGLNYTGTVLVPERQDWKVKFDYLDQIEWEDKGLSKAAKLVFWVPRRAPDMLALTTNIEFGRWIERRRTDIYYGRPDNAEHCRYLDWLYWKLVGLRPTNSLYDLLKQAAL